MYALKKENVITLVQYNLSVRLLLAGNMTIEVPLYVEAIMFSC